MMSKEKTTFKELFEYLKTKNANEHKLKIDQIIVEDLGLSEVSGTGEQLMKILDALRKLAMIELTELKNSDNELIDNRA